MMQHDDDDDHARRLLDERDWRRRERETLTLTRIRLTKDPLVKKRTLNDGVKEEEEEEEEEEVVVKESTVDRCKTGTC